MLRCRKCGAGLSNDEIGLTKKLVNRGAETFLCFDCLGRFFGAPRGRLLEMVERFRSQGCTLFAPEPGEGAAGPR